jgi:hypothetical protein
MDVETEPNVYEQYAEYVKQVDVKQSDDISAEGEDEMDLLKPLPKPFVCRNDEPAEDGKASDNDVKECA